MGLRTSLNVTRVLLTLMSLPPLPLCPLLFLLQPLWSAFSMCSACPDLLLLSPPTPLHPLTSSPPSRPSRGSSGPSHSSGLTFSALPVPRELPHHEPFHTSHLSLGLLVVVNITTNNAVIICLIIPIHSYAYLLSNYYTGWPKIRYTAESMQFIKTG